MSPPVCARTKRVVLLLALLVVTGLGLGSVLWLWAQLVSSENAAISGELAAIFYDRAKSLLTGDAALLDRLYDRTRPSGSHAYEHELARGKLTREWLRKRKVHVTHLDSDLKVVWAQLQGDRARASVCQHLLVTYHHEGDPSASTSVLGTRTIHWLECVRRDGRWLIQRDWFWDPYKDDDTRLTDVAELGRGAPYPVPSGQQAPSTLGVRGPAGRFNRAAAVAYADRYCGVRIFTGDGRYNQQYRDYTGLGGDCANFASQVLGDPEAGAIPQDWAWFNHANTASRAWLRAEDLVNYLLESGRATLLARGTLPAVTEPTPEFPDGPVYRLEPGDIIAYERHGEIAHVSVVVGQDASGYPVVNSHSGDRYHVPWDLGHHSRTKYWLLRVAY